MTERSRRWLGPSVVLLALALRLWGIGFGLPSLYHPDEGRYVVMVQQMVKTGDLNPHFFNYPSLFLYLNAAAYGPYYLAGKALGQFRSIGDIPAPTLLTMGVGFTSMPSTLLLGRLLSVAFGVGAVALLYLAGRRLTGSAGVGALAALLLAVSPAAVTASRPIVPDALLLCALLLAFYGAVGVYGTGETRCYLLAGLGVGLAAASKYNGALVGVTLVAAHLLGPAGRPRHHARVVVAGALAAVAFALATPFALLDASSFLKDLAFEARHYAQGHEGMEGDTLAWYARYLWEFEGLAAPLALAGVALGLRTAWRPTLVVVAFPLVYLPFISGFVVRNDQTLLPALPFLFLLAASLLGAAWQRLRVAPPPGALFWRAGLGAVAAVAVAWPLTVAAGQAARLGAVDGREAARRWIEESLPPGTRIALEPYSPYVDPARYVVLPISKLIDHPPEWYRQQGTEYLVFSQGMYGRYFNDPVRYRHQVDAYQRLFSVLDEVRSFDEGGFTVRIYRMPPL